MEIVNNAGEEKLLMPMPKYENTAQKREPRGPKKPDPDKPGYREIYYTYPDGIVICWQIPCP